jgi:hypothetical protein
MRNYKKEYANYHAKPEQKKRRAQRNAARRLMISKGLARKGDGKDVDHIDRNTRNNAPSNLRIQTKAKNRGRNK